MICFACSTPLVWAPVEPTCAPFRRPSPSRTSVQTRPPFRYPVRPLPRTTNVVMQAGPPPASAEDPVPSRRRARKTDDRGFVLPEPGDVVLYAGRWPDEDAAGLVESVRYLAARGAHVVDVVELRDMGRSLYEPARKRTWRDIADVHIASDATYSASLDAYRIESARSGYAASRRDAAALHRAKRASDAEYAALKARMLRVAGAAAAAGSAVAWVGWGGETGAAFAMGALAGLAYLALLQRRVDAVGGGNAGAAMIVVRFAAPVLPFVALAMGAVRGVSTGDAGASVGMGLGAVPKGQVAAVVLGLLTYKVPVVVQTAEEAVDAVAEIEVGSGTVGMVGTIAALAARAVRRARGGGDDGRGDRMAGVEDEAAAAGSNGRQAVLVFAGPSGVGKSSLIRKLFQQYGVDKFGFSVSHTTREPRENEQDGVDYNFVDLATFDAMVDASSFVEYAQVHNNKYGTSYEAIDKVLQSGRSCVLDLDVQGVESLSSKAELSWMPRFVWIAPPSLEALEARLRGRGSETEETLAKRMDTATREMSYAATSKVFDKIIVNANLNTAFKELCEFVDDVLDGRQ